MSNFNMATTREISNCGIASGCSNFQSIIKLPKLPLTEAFGNFDDSFPSFDQELLISIDSGHVQLKYQINPDILYDKNNYAFRSDNSLKSNSELQILLKFMKESSAISSKNHVLEIGANDLKFSKLLKNMFNSVSACDPLLSNEHGKIIEGIQIIGLPIEKAISDIRDTKPDVIIGRHTLEHISNPRLVIESLLEITPKNCIFIFEVPSLIHIVESLRFDAFFHQHYQYFDIESVKTLMNNVGAELINYQYNNQGSNGGSLIFAFRKSEKRYADLNGNHEKKLNWLKNRFTLYQEQMSIMKTLLDELSPPIYGFGAGLMLATFDYHLGGKLQNLECILDDDPKKDGMGYKNIDIKIRSTQKFKPADQSSFIITSLESIRPIYNRITQFNPRRIIVPSIT